MSSTSLDLFSSLFFITLGLELSDTKVYEPSREVAMSCLDFLAAIADFLKTTLDLW